MADFTTFSKDIAYHQKQDLEPNDVGGLSGEEFQALCDQAAVDIKEWILAYLAEIKATTDNASGADKIGITPISETGSADRVQAVIEALITRLKSVTDSSSGADLIGATGISGLSGSTVQSLLESLKTYFDSNGVKLTGDQTLGGVKTFSSSPVVPAPTTDMQAPTKKYVDDTNTNQTGALNTHKVSADHDGRYYTETESDNKFETKDNITNNRKLSATGNFTGTLNGMAIVAAEPGLSSEVVAARKGEVNLKAKMDSIDSQLADIPNQTYITEKAKTVDVDNALALKVDKVIGKGLSTNDYDNTEKSEVAKVALKADKTYVDTLTQSIASGSPAALFATLAALQADATANTTDGKKKIYLVSADGKWYYWSGGAWVAGGIYQGTGIADNTIYPMHLYGNKAQSYNLFNKYDVLKGYYITSDGIVTPNASLDLSGFIKVAPSTTYKASSIYYYVGFYDVNKNFLSVVNVDGINKSFTTTANTEYIRIDLEKAAVNYDTYMLVKGNTMPSTYKPYAIGVEWLAANDGSISYDSLDDTVTSKFLDINYTQNLLNLRAMSIGKVVVNDSGELPNADYSVSEYIEVDASTNYTITYADVNFCACYDKDKKYLTTLVANATNYTFTTPANTKYIRVNVLNAHKANCILVLGSLHPNGFVPYGGTDDMLHYKKATKWHGKKIVTFGDSITWYDGNNFSATHMQNGTLCKGYQTYMRDILKCSVVNQGISGNTMPDINVRIKAYDFTNVDAVTITAGANDFRLIPSKIGTIRPIGSVFDNTTYFGALQESIEYILGVNPEIKIYLITPIRGWDGSENTIMPTTYPDAIKEVGKLYALSVCDWYYTSGINDLTMLTYMGDLPTNGYYLHPNNKGYERMANVLIPFLENN